MSRPPGVLVEERYVVPAPALHTGVPVFLGNARPAPDTPLGPLASAADLARFEIDEGSVLGDAVRGFFAGGGRQCHVVGIPPDPDATRARRLDLALDAAGALDDVDLVCAPDTAAWPDPEDVHAALLAHCAAHGDRFALLDGPREGFAPGGVGVAHGAWGALYGPWLGVEAPDLPARPGSGAVPVRFVPPSGHVAGLYARTDERAGTHHAPAGETLVGVVEPAAVPTDAELGLVPRTAGSPPTLLDRGVNAVRARPGRGLVVGSARTLDPAPGSRHVSVRRTLLTIGRWIRRFLSVLVHEPGDVRLQVRITRELSAYLDGLHARGALRGDTPAEAYFVRCDGETNPRDVVERGQVVTQVGVALRTPAEFIDVRVVHDAGGVTVSTEE